MSVPPVFLCIGIRLEFEGKAIVEWTHSKTVEYEKRYVEETWRYYSEEEYFKKDFLQYGAGDWSQLLLSFLDKTFSIVHALYRSPIRGQF